MVDAQKLKVYTEVNISRFVSSPIVDDIDFIYEVKIHNKTTLPWHLLFLKLTIKDVFKVNRRSLPIDLAYFPQSILPDSFYRFKRTISLEYHLGNILCEAMVYNSTCGFKLLSSKQDLVGLPFLN